MSVSSPVCSTEYDYNDRQECTDEEPMKSTLDTTADVPLLRTNQSSSKCKRRTYIMLLTVFSAIGGCLFGYDTGIVSGAMIKVDRVFDLTHLWHELIVSVTLGAAIITAVLGGPLTDLLGRKIVLISSSVVFTAGAVLLSASGTKEVLLVGRIVVGLAIGLSSMSVPIYIAESAPAKIRGKLVVLNVAFITGGQFLASLVSGIFSNDLWPWGWRVMFGFAGVPSVIMFFGMLFMPESPRWLVFHNKQEKARTVLMKTRTPEEAKQELDSIIADFEEHQKQAMGLLQFFKRLIRSRTVLMALIVGCGLQMFQQLSGINTIMYYSGNIIQLAGFPGNAAIWLTCIPSFGNFFFTLIGELLVDRIGRRKLILGSISGVIVSLLAISGVFHLLNVRSLAGNNFYPNSTCHHDRCLYCVADEKCGFCARFNQSTGSYTSGTCSAVDESTNVGYFVESEGYVVDCSEPASSNVSLTSNVTDGDLQWFVNTCTHDPIASLAVACLFMYLAFFAPGMGPVPWTVNSEIYPTWARGFGVSMSTTVNWVFNLIVSFTFLSLLDALTPAVGFLLIAGFAVLCLIFIFLLLPETKKKTLEEMEVLFKKPYFLSWCKCPSNYSIQ